ncbi:MAG: 6-hydroxymethylpterin diphosphokinase MptE-like protein [Candidatus Hodarchaeales archaeon]
MKWNDWKLYYYEILTILKIDEKSDIQSCKLLKDKIQPIIEQNFTRTQEKLRTLFSSPLLIAGAGPSLENDVKTLIKLTTSRTFSLVSCDGSTSLFKEFNIKPDVVFTDLDGDHLALEWALKNRALVLIHAHGDNIPLVESFISKNQTLLSKGSVLGTCQCNTGNILLNYGGFTDGDRAIFTAFHYQSPIIGLIGFDLGKIIGKYSTLNSPTLKDTARKIIKLKIAKDLISQTFLFHSGRRFNLTSKGERIPGFPKSTLDSFIDFCNLWYKTQNKKGFPKLLQ